MIKILLVTSEWPTKEHPEWVPFLVNEVTELRKAGHVIDIFSFRGKKCISNYLNAWYSLRRKYNLLDYDLIHAQWGQNGLLALPKTVPLVTTFRGSDLEGILNQNGKNSLKGKFLQLASKLSAKFSDKVILVSDSLAKYIPNHAYQVLPVCLDINLFRPLDKLVTRNSLHLPLEEFLILFPSNPDRLEKRYKLAEEAVNILKQKINCRLIVTKDIPHQLMVNYLNACDVLLITSSHEGSPTVVYEALACNLPIVSSDVGDVRNRVAHIEGCYICESGSPSEFSEHLHQVYKNNSRIIGHEHIKEFSSENFVKQLGFIYDEAIKSFRNKRKISIR